MLAAFQTDAGARLRVSQLTTLADLKCLNADDALLWENVGTGTGSFASNKYTMSVSPGQYLIRKSRRYYPYFSGKSQQVEFTMDTFAPQDGVVKRYGYFSSSAVAPYDSNLDGFFIQSDSDGVTFNVYNNGTLIRRENLNKGVNEVPFDGYDWNNFTVVELSYLWLGGAVARLFGKVGPNFEVGDVFNYAGTSPGKFTMSSNHCVRAEIRSTTGSGSMRQICAQVSTEGSINESAKGYAINSGNTAIAMASVGTTYPLLAIRKKAGFRDVGIKVSDFAALVTSTNDLLRLSLHINPTLSAPLTWADVANAAFQRAVGNGTITATSPGHVISETFASVNAIMPYGALEREFLSWLGVDINDVSDQMVLCGTPLTATVSAHAEIDVLQS